MVWIKRIAIGLGVLVGAIALIFFGLIAFDAVFGRSTSDYTNITFAGDDGIDRVGYLAQPDTPGPHPGVLLIHEWWGLNDGITQLADALAAEGYVVLAADAYRGETTNLFPRALWLRVTTPQEEIFADVDAAFEHLRALETVDADRVASMGFCFGGGESLQLGMRQGENLALTIIYYGAVVTEPDLLRPLTEGRGVLGVFGEEDQQIFVEDVLEFEAALNTLNIPNEITIYPDVGHAFLNEENYDEPGAAMDAWQQTLAFLEENLKTE